MYKNNGEFERSVKTIAFTIHKGDVELLAELTRFLGCSRAEAIRTSIRSMVAQLGILKQ